MEYWIERMIWYLKLYLKDRVKDSGEIIFVNDHLLVRSSKSCRSQFPKHCLTMEERRASGREMSYPDYDQAADGALLIGRRCAAGIEEGESHEVLALLPRVLAASQSWYRSRGWPAASAGVLVNMAARGRLVIDKYMGASLPSMDVITCVQDRTHTATDNRWIYVMYTYEGGVEVACVGLVQYFVRVRATNGAAHVFDAGAQVGIQGEPGPVVRNRHGRRRCAQPLRLAVCKVWRAEVCPVIGEAGSGPLARPVPDLLRIRNMADGDTDKLPAHGGAPRPGMTGRYYGLYLVDICEISTQLVPTIELPVQPQGSQKKQRAPRVQRYFMTCCKLSGK